MKQKTRTVLKFFSHRKTVCSIHKQSLAWSELKGLTMFMKLKQQYQPETA